MVDGEPGKENDMSGPACPTARWRNRRRKLIVASLAAATLLAPFRADTHAQTRSLDLVGHLTGGGVRAVALEGERAYAGIGHRLVVLDAAPPGPIAVLGTTGLLPGIPVDIRVQGDLALVATTDSPALVLVDVSAPRQPRILSTTPLEGEVGAVDVANGHAFVGGWDWRTDVGEVGWLWALDLRDPAAPVVVGRFSRLLQPLAPWVVDLAIAGDRAFVTLGDVLVVDIADPTRLREVTTFGLEGVEGAGIALAGNRAYVAVAAGVDTNALRVFDIADPDHPNPLASAPLPRIPLSVAVRGQRAYVGLSFLDTFGCGTGPDDFGRVEVLDIGGPGDPVSLGTVTLPYNAYALAVDAADRVLAAAGGLQQIDFADPPNAAATAVMATAMGGVTGLAAMGEHVFVANRRTTYDSSDPYREHIVAVDVRDPARPQTVGEIEVRRGLGDPLVAAGGVIYNLDWPSQSLELIDARDPTRLRRLAALSFGDYAYPYTLALADGYAYVTLRGEIAVVDVRAPAAPFEVSRIRVIGMESGGLAVDRGLLFVQRETGASSPNSRRQLLAFDVRDPGHPRQVGTLDLVGDEGRLSAIVADSGFVVLSGAMIVDAREPTRLRPWLRLDPVRIGTRAAVIRDHRLYTVAGNCLRAFDLTSPGPPVEIAALTEPGPTPYLRALDAVGDTVYLANDAGGILIARFGNNPPSPGSACLSTTWLPARSAAYLPFALRR